jgi:hypothetical protein
MAFRTMPLAPSSDKTGRSCLLAISLGQNVWLIISEYRVTVAIQMGEPSPVLIGRQIAVADPIHQYKRNTKTKLPCKKKQVNTIVKYTQVQMSFIILSSRKNKISQDMVSCSGATNGWGYTFHNMRRTCKPSASRFISSTYEQMACGPHAAFALSIHDPA